jgi:hypothetical protein
VKDYAVYRPARDVMREAMRLVNVSDDDVNLRQVIALVGELAAVIDDTFMAHSVTDGVAQQ